MAYDSLERNEAYVIETITNTGLKYNESEEAVDMCKAIQQMREEERKIGEKTGEKAGELKKAREASINFYNMGVEVEKIAQGLGYAVETVKEWLNVPVNR